MSDGRGGREDAEGGYRTKNKNPTRQCGGKNIWESGTFLYATPICSVSCSLKGMKHLELLNSDAVTVLSCYPHHFYFPSYHLQLAPSWANPMAKSTARVAKIRAIAMTREGPKQKPSSWESLMCCLWLRQCLTARG